MSNFKKQLRSRILNEDETFAPTPIPQEPVIMEPQTGEDSDDSDEGIMPDIYDLYPNLAEIDITDPCSLADFFATVCEEVTAAAEEEMDDDSENPDESTFAADEDEDDFV